MRDGLAYQAKTRGPGKKGQPLQESKHMKAQGATPPPFPSSPLLRTARQKQISAAGMSMMHLRFNQDQQPVLTGGNSKAPRGGMMHRRLRSRLGEAASPVSSIKCPRPPFPGQRQTLLLPVHCKFVLGDKAVDSGVGVAVVHQDPHPLPGKEKMDWPHIPRGQCVVKTVAVVTAEKKRVRGDMKGLPDLWAREPEIKGCPGAGVAVARIRHPSCGWAPPLEAVE